MVVFGRIVRDWYFGSVGCAIKKRTNRAIVVLNVAAVVVSEGIFMAVVHVLLMPPTTTSSAQ